MGRRPDGYGLQYFRKNGIDPAVGQHAVFKKSAEGLRIAAHRACRDLQVLFLQGRINVCRRHTQRQLFRVEPDPAY